MTLVTLVTSVSVRRVGIRVVLETDLICGYGVREGSCDQCIALKRFNSIYFFGNLFVCLFLLAALRILNSDLACADQPVVEALVRCFENKLWLCGREGG